jgi:hypothetical protein
MRTRQLTNGEMVFEPTPQSASARDRADSDPLHGHASRLISMNDK